MRMLTRAGIGALCVLAVSCDKPSPYGPEKIVVVASRDIQGFELLDETNLTLASVPKEFVLPKASPNLSEYRSTVSLAPLRKGEQLLATKILKHGPETMLLRELASTRNDEATLARFSIAIAEALAAAPESYDPGAPYTKLVETSKTLCLSKDKLACYWLGLVFRRKQPSDMILYLTKSCELGEAAACNDIGFIYATGEGIPVDAGNAKKFYEKACALKFPSGCKNLAGLDNK